LQPISLSQLSESFILDLSLVLIDVYITEVEVLYSDVFIFHQDVDFVPQKLVAVDTK
jgi:hypothetical protein